jgi:hypothetical protein
LTDGLSILDRCILSINKPTPDKFDFKKAIYVPTGKGKDKLSMYWSKRESLYKLAFHIKPVLAEDVDIPTDNMVFMPSNGNRMLDYIQSIGRVGRASKDSP